MEKTAGRSRSVQKSDVKLDIYMTKDAEFHDKQDLIVPNISVVLSLRQFVGLSIKTLGFC